MRLYDFRTEYRENPIGLTEKAPRFSWKIESDEKDTVQTSYEIKVTDESGKLVWDSGKKVSDQSVLISYEGEVLAERRKCLISCMASVAAKAAEAGIVCCFHPNSAKNSLFRTEEDYEAMFELIQPTAIGWAPDVGHIENGGMSAIEQMKAHRDLIRHVHFKDRIAQNEWAVMGEGKIDYPAIIKYLAETGYLGWIMVEDESPRAETDSDGVVAEDGKYMCRQIHR